ncbi:hypothetical protein F7725_022442 [Dissostichus mawsoni]|uniref:Uncharacterized protein n=1 Tax=Dissostichus mawsoni TaxID=36200 RepID=A0A7J5Z0U9_DISMA|nr:hypothetical protein F7725_022442 [Dissostichus mawsoni]
MAVLIVEGRAHQLLSSNGNVRELPTIYSNQEETDTRVVLYLHHAAAFGIPGRRLLSHTSWIPCVQRRRLHQCLQREGKVGPLKNLEKNPKFHRAFSQLGDNWNVKPEVLKQLEQFTCLIYGES